MVILLCSSTFVGAIIGGSSTDIEYPYRIRLRQNNTACSGSIIHERYVITARTCTIIGSKFYYSTATIDTVDGKLGVSQNQLKQLMKYLQFPTVHGKNEV